VYWVNISSGQDNNYRPISFFTIFVEVAAAKSCLQFLFNFASLITENWVYAIFANKLVGLPLPKPFARAFEGVNPSEPLSMALPISRNLDLHLVIVIMHFQIKSSKKAYWWHFAHCPSRFQRRYIDFDCKNLVSWLLNWPELLTNHVFYIWQRNYFFLLVYIVGSHM